MTPQGLVFRGNACLNNAAMSIGGRSTDVLVEHNFVSHNDVGISVSPTTTSGVWLRGNTFEDVGTPFASFASYAPGLGCCCNSTDAATNVSIVVKPFASYTECTAGSCEAAGEPNPW